MLRSFLVCAAALACFGLVAFAQPAGGPAKKVDSRKGKDETDKSKSKDAGKSKTVEKAQPPIKDEPGVKTPLEKMKLPQNAIVVIVEDLLKAGSLIPKAAVIPLEEWLALKDRLKELERQAKTEKALVSTCKLRGKLEGDFLVITADYVLATRQPNSTVSLGLQGGHLWWDEGQIDKQPPILDFDKDEGFTVRIEKEGTHRLSLKVRVPVKKSAAGGLDRSIELGLPASAGTMLTLEMPPAVKELRWNGTQEKFLSPGRWQIGLERTKLLNLAWKEPLPPSGNPPLARVESQIRVEVDPTHVNVTADLFLEDSRLKTQEWHLHLPPQARVEAVKGPAGLLFKLEDKGPYPILQVPVSSDRWQVTVTQRIPRPNPGSRVAIGPFNVLGSYKDKGAVEMFGAFQPHGTISVKMSPEAGLGQRIVYLRSEKFTTQTKNTETEAVFQFIAPTLTEKNLKSPLALKAPLELEWRFEKNQLRTSVKHDLHLKAVNQGFEIDATTRIHVAALFSTIGAVDLKLPPTQPPGLAMIGTASPGMPFPGALPWTGLWNAFGMPWTLAAPGEISITDESGNALTLVPQEATGKTRVLWTRGSVKELTMILRSTYRIPPGNRRFRLELPRPLNTQDRGAKLVIQADDRVELLHGPEGAEEPVPDRHRFDLSWDQAPTTLDIAWRPHHREVVTQSTIDIDVHEHTAQVQQSLRFPRDRAQSGPEAKNSHVLLATPAGIGKVELLAGGEIINHDRDRQLLWFRPTADTSDIVEIRLHYDLAVANERLAVTPIWPTHGSLEDVKVRVWTPPGVQARPTSSSMQHGQWKERSIELVRERETFPTLVLAGYGARLPLTLALDHSAAASLAAVLADRAFVQVRTLEDGSQQVQARYLVRKIHSAHLDVELPLALSLFREPPTFLLGKQMLGQWKKLDTAERVMRLQLTPELTALPAVLEISYTIPADALERGNMWSTTLHAPSFRSDVVIGQVRWQFTAAMPMIAASFKRNVRAETNWVLQGWLFAPEAVSADWDSWLVTGKDSGQPGAPVTFAFAHASVEPETIYHLPRQAWLLGCSGIFLVLTLGVFFLPLPRWVFASWLCMLGVGFLAFALAFPSAWPGVAFGLQPGVLLFLVFVGIHWLMLERYRRQLVFLPGFTPGKPGSTVTRTNAPNRPRENSTVDAPPGAIDGANSGASGT